MNKPKRVFITCLFLVSMASIVSHAQDKDIALLIQQLEHTDEDVQYSARKSLIEIGKAAVPALIVGLNHENAVVRKEVVGILRDIWLNNRRIIFELPKLKSLDANMNDIPRDEDLVSRNEDITCALVKVLEDDDYEVRSEARGHFLVLSMIPWKGLAPDLVHSLCYGSPFFPDFTERRGDLGDMARAARITHALYSHSDVLQSTSWQIRFGAAIAYGYGICRRKVFLEQLPHPSKTVKAIISTLAEGLTHPDWQTREDAIKVLSCLNFNYYRHFDDRARQAFEALPPFGIVSQTIRNGEVVSDSVVLDSLNTDGITFKFNRSIDSSGTITIRPLMIEMEYVDDAEPLGWNVEKNSHSITITPPEGKELVNPQKYMIQLRDFNDVVRGYRFGADIEFTIYVPLHRRAH